MYSTSYMHTITKYFQQWNKSNYSVRVTYLWYNTSITYISNVANSGDSIIVDNISRLIMSQILPLCMDTVLLTQYGITHCMIPVSPPTTAQLNLNYLQRIVKIVRVSDFWHISIVVLWYKYYVIGYIVSMLMSENCLLSIPII